jgi:beta-glucosidase
VAFARVALGPGESSRLNLSIPFDRLALVDAYERRVVEPGEFELRVGGTSDPAALLRARFRVEGAPFSFAAIPGVLPDTATSQVES